MKDTYYIVEENTLVYTTGRSNQFGIECGVLVASQIRARLYGKAKNDSRFKRGDVIHLNDSNIPCYGSSDYREATRKDFSVFGVQFPSNA